MGRVDQAKLETGGGHGLPHPAQLGPMVPIVIGAGIFGGSVGIVAALVVVMLMVGISVLRR